MIYVFDVNGTLVDNAGGLSNEQCERIVRRISEDGHLVLLWTGDVFGVPKGLLPYAHEVVSKCDFPDVALELACFVDDDLELLGCMSKLGAWTMHARRLAGWLPIIDSCDGVQRLVPNPIHLMVPRRRWLRPAEAAY